MKLLERLTFKRKLLLYAFATCATALFLQSMVYFGFKVLECYRDLPKSLAITADLVGLNASAALMFEDQKAAEETLAGLSADENVLSACIITADGSQFAKYVRKGLGDDTPNYRIYTGHAFINGELHVSRPIVTDGERVGYVIIRYSLAELYAELRNLSLALLGFLGLSLLLALAPASRLQQYISEPIVALATMTKEVAGSKNYALRATRRSNDELGDLTDSFNLMLEQIQQRDSALQEMNDVLEERVAERTREVQARSEELEERRRTVTLLQTVATASNAATTLSGVLQVALDEVCGYTGWPVGHVYLVTKDGTADLITTNIWHLEDESRFAEFRSATQVTTFLAGAGLPGQVLLTKKPIWIANLPDHVRNESFARASVAKSVGICAAFSFPILLKDEVVAVLEFFHTDAADPDEQLLRIMTSVGTSLSRVVERQRATEALRERENKLRDKNAEMEKAAIALAESENHLRTIYDSEPECVKMVAPDGSVMDMNPAGLRMIDAASLKEIRGKSVFSLIAEDHVEAYRALHKSVMAGETGTLVFQICGLKGRMMWMETHAVPLRDESGNVYAHLAVSRDITEQRQAVEALREAKEAAEAGNRAKSEFLANMSHEIRTPLNGIIGMSELALDTGLTREQEGFMQSVVDCSHSLLDIINDILDFSKIEAGKLSLESTPFDLLATCESVLELIAHRAAPKQLELTSDMRSDVPHELLGDPVRLRQVLINLLGNAEKFTAEGEVALLVEVVNRRDDAVSLKFSVRDTGTGIPQARLDAIFESFTQADGTTTRQFGGTGLGLGISRQLVELMGGELTVVSELGVGSTFHFTIALPIAPIQSGDSPAKPRLLADEGALGRTAILVVDDNKTNRDILQTLLASWGCEVAVAESGPTALEALRAAVDSDRSFDIVILDVQMPEMDGLEVERHIRKDVTLGRPKILFASSIGNRRAIEELAGDDAPDAAAFLMKPLKRDLLKTAILSAVGVESDNSPQSKGASLQPASDVCAYAARILLVEDNPVNRKVATGMLKKFGYDISIAENGRIALDVLKEETFDIILMDVQMPEMDGMEATRRIRADERIKEIPIVAMTANAMEGDREKCLAAGMDDYLSKPINAAKLRKMVETWMQQTKTAHVAN